MSVISNTAAPPRHAKSPRRIFEEMSVAERNELYGRLGHDREYGERHAETTEPSVDEMEEGLQRIQLALQLVLRANDLINTPVEHVGPGWAWTMEADKAGRAHVLLIHAEENLKVLHSAIMTSITVAANDRDTKRPTVVTETAPANIDPKPVLPMKSADSIGIGDTVAFRQHSEPEQERLAGTITAVYEFVGGITFVIWRRPDGGFDGGDPGELRVVAAADAAGVERMKFREALTLLGYEPLADEDRGFEYSQINASFAKRALDRVHLARDLQHRALDLIRQPTEEGTPGWTWADDGVAGWYLTLGQHAERELDGLYGSVLCAYTSKANDAALREEVPA